MRAYDMKTTTIFSLTMWQGARAESKSCSARFNMSGISGGARKNSLGGPLKFD